MAKSMKPGGGGRFAALKSELSHKRGITDPGALAASVGRKKYGGTKMADMSGAGRHHHSPGEGKHHHGDGILTGGHDHEKDEMGLHHHGDGMMGGHHGHDDGSGGEHDHGD